MYKQFESHAGRISESYDFYHSALVGRAAQTFANIKLAAESDREESDTFRFDTLSDLGAHYSFCCAYASCATVEQLVTILRARPDWLYWCIQSRVVPEDLLDALRNDYALPVALSARDRVLDIGKY